MNHFKGDFMKRFLATLFIFSTLPAFASSNMLIPVLDCKLTKSEIQKLKDSRSSNPEGLSIMADIEDALKEQEGRAILIYTGKHVGKTSEVPERLNNFLNSANFGTFNGKLFDLKNNELESGTIFTSDHVFYSEKYQGKTTLKIKVEEKSSEDFTATLTFDAFSGSTTYNCNSYFK